MLTIKSINEGPLRQLEQMGNLVQGSGNCLEKALRDKNVLERTAVQAAELALKGHKLTGELIIRLNKSFITSLDREDIGNIAFELQRLLTRNQGILELLVLLKPGLPLTPEGLQLGIHLVTAITDLNLAVSLLKKVEKDSQLLFRCCERVSQSTYNGERCYREALAAVLFFNDKDHLDTVKWKEIFGELAKALDHCARAADLLKGVVLKYG
ncbi:MAG: hypothetical protein M0021_15840 [Clostridia bacterium]|nr:hypothetical protein [Clostridia bacterium]